MDVVELVSSSEDEVSLKKAAKVIPRSRVTSETPDNASRPKRRVFESSDSSEDSSVNDQEEEDQWECTGTRTLQVQSEKIGKEQDNRSIDSRTPNESLAKTCQDILPTLIPKNDAERNMVQSSVLRLHANDDVGSFRDENEANLDDDEDEQPPSDFDYSEDELQVALSTREFSDADEEQDGEYFDQQDVVDLMGSESDDEGEERDEDAESRMKRLLLLDELKALDVEEQRLNEERSRVDTMLANVSSKRDSVRRQLALLRGDESKSKTWSAETFPHSKRLREVLKQVFGFSEFRSLQLEVMNATMCKRDCFVVLPTGAGKSLLFQMPAVVESGITVVISPLLSLSRDQIMSLGEKGIEAIMISSEQSPDETKMAFARIFAADPQLRLVYVTPEMLVQSKKLLGALENLQRKRVLTRIVLDEAHCCSTMGHDFRPDYQKLFFIKRQFPRVPLLCVTATATVDVEQDCKRVLMREGEDDWLVFRTSSNRPNLFYQVVEKKSSAAGFLNQLVHLVSTQFHNQSGIVYCFSRKDTETTAAYLADQGIPARAYHAKLGPEEKRVTHERWRSNKIRIVCATTAFGMGIDKPDVRFVIHSTLSTSIEGYAQESGRAGRDGKHATCVIMYRRADVSRVMQCVFDKQNGADKVLEMVAYCEALGACRRGVMGRCFGEEIAPLDTPTNCCDVCSRPPTSSCQQTDVTAEGESMLRRFLEIRSGEASITLAQLVDAWRSTTGSALFRAPQEWSKSQCERLAMRMLLDRVLKVHFQYTSYGANCYVQEGDRARALLRQFKQRDVVLFVDVLASDGKGLTKGKDDEAFGNDEDGEDSLLGSSSKKKKAKKSGTTTKSSSKGKVKDVKSSIDVRKKFKVEESKKGSETTTIKSMFARSQTVDLAIDSQPEYLPDDVTDSIDNEVIQRAQLISSAVSQGSDQQSHHAVLKGMNQSGITRGPEENSKTSTLPFAAPKRSVINSFGNYQQAHSQSSSNSTRTTSGLSSSAHNASSVATSSIQPSVAPPSKIGKFSQDSASYVARGNEPALEATSTPSIKRVAYDDEFEEDDVFADDFNPGPSRFSLKAVIPPRPPITIRPKPSVTVGSAKPLTMSSATKGLSSIEQIQENEKGFVSARSFSMMSGQEKVIKDAAKSKVASSSNPTKSLFDLAPLPSSLRSNHQTTGGGFGQGHDDDTFDPDAYYNS